jgi:glycerophosphoryl diester phosphodiesterase
VRARPLLEAVERGFASVEVDVVLVDGVLYVAHEEESVRPSGTLAHLYLDPLRDLVQRNGGHVYPMSDAPLQLLIDVKSAAAETYVALDEELGAYDDVLTRWTTDGVRHGPVVALLSGNRSFDLVVSDPVRYVALDGRVTEERSSYSVDTMPLVSIDWEMVESLSPSQRMVKAQEWIDAVHRENRKVRFWGTPDREQVWASLLAMGADHIGTDDVVRLERALRER